MYDDWKKGTHLNLDYKWNLELPMVIAIGKKENHVDIYTDMAWVMF